MCEQRESMQAIRNAALCLTEACMEPADHVIACVSALYDSTIQEKIPPAMVEILSKLG